MSKKLMPLCRHCGESLLLEAMELAIRAHIGQLDKAGKPYIDHPWAVMDSVDTIEDKIVAILHDVIENHPEYTEEVSELIGEDLFADLLGVTRITSPREETYKEFIHRASERPRSRRVKIADLRHNLDSLRVRPELTGIEIRYKEALEILKLKEKQEDLLRRVNICDTVQRQLDMAPAWLRNRLPEISTAHPIACFSLPPQFFTRYIKDTAFGMYHINCGHCASYTSCLAHKGPLLVAPILDATQAVIDGLISNAKKVK